MTSTQMTDDFFLKCDDLTLFDIIRPDSARMILPPAAPQIQADQCQVSFDEQICQETPPCRFHDVS